jgi:hypothetical protein
MRQEEPAWLIEPAAPSRFSFRNPCLTVQKNRSMNGGTKAIVTPAAIVICGP